MGKGRSKSVLVFSEVRGDTRRYRALHLIEQLELLGVERSSVHLSDFDIDAAFQRRWDMVVFHRMAYSKHVASILDSLQAQGSIILSDFDDLIFDTRMFDFINSPDFADPVRARLYKANMDAIRGVLEKSEGVLTSTDYLGEHVQSLGKPTWVHRNAFSLEMLKSSERALTMPRHPEDPERVVIGYASGTLTHNRDFEMIRPALIRVLEAHPNAELRLVGPLDAGKDWGKAARQVSRKPRVPWRKLPEVLRQFDINLAPLVMDNPFSQSKSEIKFMEAAMVGVPTIASPTDAFCYAIRSGENGYLAESCEDWERILSQLIEDRSLREATGERARVEVLRDYHPITRAAQLGSLLDKISLDLRGVPFWDENPPDHTALEQQAKGIAAREEWLPEGFEKDPSPIKLGIYALRHYGIKTTLFKVWIIFRRLIAPIFPFKAKK